MLQRVPFGRMPMNTSTLLLGGACGVGEKLIIVSLKANLQSLIDLKVLSTIKTETIRT